jgi:hypothetical protein
MTATATTDTSLAAPTVGDLRELARYTTATGTERALGGQRVDGVVVVTDYARSPVPLERQRQAAKRTSPERGKELRWAVYNEVKGQRFERTDEEWAPFLRSPTRRLEQLLVWPESSPLARWRLIEAWTIAAHGPYMAVAGGFRLAFWSEEAAHLGPRLDGALVR